MKIVMLDPLGVPDKIVLEYKKQLEGKGYQFIECLKPLTDNEKLEISKDADILVITNNELKKEYISSNTKFISVGFTGVNHVPMSYCKENDIVVSNSQGYATIPTAELALALMLEQARNITKTIVRNQNSKTKDGLVGFEITNKKVGIVGTGQIGTHLAKLLTGFDCELYGYDVTENEVAKGLGVKYTTLEKIFSECDIISLHLPLTDKTKYIVDKNLLSTMKDTSILINCARGDIINSKDLKEALENNVFKGAGVDVYDIEPPLPKDHILLHNSKITATPHIAFASVESMERRAHIVFKNVIEFLNGKPINVQ